MCFQKNHKIQKINHLTFFCAWVECLSCLQVALVGAYLLFLSCQQRTNQQPINVDKNAEHPSQCAVIRRTHGPRFMHLIPGCSWECMTGGCPHALDPLKANRVSDCSPFPPDSLSPVGQHEWTQGVVHSRKFGHRRRQRKTVTLSDLRKIS